MTTDKTLQLNKVQKLIMLAIVLSAFTGIVIGLLRERGLDGTALLYIGIPTIIGIAFASTPTATSAVGATLKALTFMILISGPLLQEGFICMIMAAPILYIVGALAALITIVKRNNAARMPPGSTYLCCQHCYC